MANLSNINNVLRVSSDLRVGINTDAASYALEIGGTNSGIKLKNSNPTNGRVYSLLSDTSGNFQIYDDAAASGRLVISNLGNSTFAGIVETNKTFVAKGQNVTHATSAIKISQENTTKSQIRCYGADASTAGAFELVLSANDGTPGYTALAFDSSANATFAGNIRTGTSTLTANTNFDNLVIEGSAHTGITIFSGTSSDGGIYFGDSGANNLVK